MALLETLSWGLSGAFLSESARSGSFCWAVRPQLSPERGCCECSSLLASGCDAWLGGQAGRGAGIRTGNSPQGPLPGEKASPRHCQISPSQRAKRGGEEGSNTADPPAKHSPPPGFIAASLHSSGGAAMPEEDWLKLPSIASVSSFGEPSGS